MNDTDKTAGSDCPAATGSAFSLAQVLSITTGRLCCDMGGVYEILNHVTGDNIFTHVFMRAIRFAAPLILEQFPELEAAGKESSLQRLADEIEAAREPMDGVKAWLAALGLRDQYEITSHADAWLSMDPLEELESIP